MQRLDTKFIETIGDRNGEATKLPNWKKCRSNAIECGSDVMLEYIYLGLRPTVIRINSLIDEFMKKLTGLESVDFRGYIKWVDDYTVRLSYEYNDHDVKIEFGLARIDIEVEENVDKDTQYTTLTGYYFSLNSYVHELKYLTNGKRNISYIDMPTDGDILRGYDEFKDYEELDELIQRKLWSSLQDKLQ